MSSNSLMSNNFNNNNIEKTLNASEQKLRIILEKVFIHL